MNVTCPACSASVNVEDESVGRAVRCTCGMTFVATPSITRPTSTLANGKGRAGPSDERKPLLPMAGVVALGVLVVSLAGVAAAVYYVREFSSAGTAKATAPTNTGPKRPPPSSLGPPVASLRGDVLWDSFGVDEAAAKAKYVGKTVEVTVRGRPSRDRDGKPFFGGVVVQPSPHTPAQLSRLSAQERQWEEGGYPPNLICYFPPERKGEFEKVPPDQDCVVRGVCAGRQRANNVYMSYVVVLERCELVNPPQ
jgi:predicted Zn finger-like uncharacterized protein